MPFNSIIAYRSSFNYLTSTFNTPNVIGEFHNSEVYCIAVDWLKKIMYRCLRTECIKSDLHGTDTGYTRKAWLQRKSTLTDLKIDPQTR